MSICPYVELVDQRAFGALGASEEMKLRDHLPSCPMCRAALHDHEALEEAVFGEFEELDSELLDTRALLIERIGAAIRSDDELVTSAKLRRLQGRFMLFAIQFAAGFLILLAYAGSMVGIKLRESRERELFTRVEIHALTVCTRVYLGALKVLPPAGNAALVQRLRQPYKAGKPYYSFPAERLRDGRFLDRWSQPYVYQRTDGGFRIYSLGPNGKDDGGAGDDIGLISKRRPRKN